MTIRPSELQMFNGKKIRAVVSGNMKAVEDIDDIRTHLQTKYGADNIKENPNSFIVKGKKYLKPWVPRERTGIFHVKGSMYYIETLERSTEDGRMKPRYSLYPIDKLTMVDPNTIHCMVKEDNNEYIRYTLITD